jgi:hypothetical protein
MLGTKLIMVLGHNNCGAVNATLTALQRRRFRRAGRQLAARLQQLREEKPVVLASPRGGVPVGFAHETHRDPSRAKRCTYMGSRVKPFLIRGL